MLKRLLDRRVDRKIAGFEAFSGQSAAYLRDIYKASHRAFFKYMRFQNGMGQHNEAAPKEAMTVAAIAAMRQQDCGPCMQITVRFAELNGVAPGIIEAAVRGDANRLPGLLKTVFHYADAVARRDAASVSYQETVQQAYGDKGLIDLAFAIASAGVYPALKRALGHGMACTQVTISDTVIPMTTDPDTPHVSAMA